MKTYWLQGREARTPVSRILDIVSAPNDDLTATETNKVSVNVKDMDRRTNVYSPITFQDVARRSIAGSPIKNIVNTTRG